MYPPHANGLVELTEASRIASSREQFILDSAHFFPLDEVVEDTSMALLEASARSQRSGISSQGATLSPSTTTAEGGSLLEVASLPSGIADTDPGWVGAAKKAGDAVPRPGGIGRPMGLRLHAYGRAGPMAGSDQLGKAAGNKACGVSLAKHLRLSREQGEKGRARRLQLGGESAPGGGERDAMAR